MLFAPNAGADTRDMLRERAGQGRDYLRDRGGSLADSASELIERGREMMSRQRDHLREAIDAGKQAYRDTVNRPPEIPPSNPSPSL
jgi:gas vesicle protein